MQELEKRIALLRLLLADIGSKLSQLSNMEGQYRDQLARIVDFVVYREGDVSNAVSLMSEVQDKLDEVVRTRGHIKMIEQRANTELDVLVLTKHVSEARSQLAELEARQQELSERLSHLPPTEAGPAASGFDGQDYDIRQIHDEVAAVSHEMARLNDLITEASERAARTVQAGK